MTLDQKLVEIIARLQEQLDTVAPLAWRAALTVTRINALWDFIAGCGLGIGIWLTIRWLRRWWRQELGSNQADDRQIGTVIVAILLGVGVSAEFFLLLNPWTYIGLFRPELRLAHDLLEKLVKP